MLAAGLLASPAARAADCAVTQKDLKSQFLAKLPKGMKLLSTKLDKKARSFTQELKVPDGVTVTVELGGCERFRYAFILKGPTLNTKTVGAELLAVSRRVLPTLPMREDAIADPKRLLKALEEAQIVALPAQWSCGEGTCTLSLDPDPKAKPKGKAKPKPKPKKDGEAADKPAEPTPEGPALMRLGYEGPELG